MTIKQLNEYLGTYRVKGVSPIHVAEHAALVCGLPMDAGLVVCSDGPCEVCTVDGGLTYFAEEI